MPEQAKEHAERDEQDDDRERQAKIIRLDPGREKRAILSADYAADEEETKRAYVAFGAVMDLALHLGGTITGEHGIGIVKLRYLERQLGADHMALLRRIKAAFDPNGILNPGKLGS